MSETLLASLGSDIQQSDPSPASTSSGSSSSLFQRKIEFHPARKPFKGFSNGGAAADFRLETLNPGGGSDQRRSGSGQLGSQGKRGDGSEFLENGLDPELSFGITVRKIGAGLQNLGNTCFLNSVLQCLTYTEPLAAYLQSSKHQNSCHIAGFCVLCAIQKHVSCALQSTGRILAPNDFVRNLQCISRNFRKARQEDAHEYMVNLLESMHKCCLPSGVPSESPGAYEKSLVHKIFGGRLRSQVKCLQCSYCSNKFDPFLDLSLEIVQADSLHKALVNFTAAEQLDGGERQYQCQQCKQKVRALKQLTVHKAPYVLAIHLKRFHSHDPGQKIKKKVHFGPTIDLKPFVSGSYEGDLKYTLYGVLVHDGWNTHYGHYTCFVRTSNGFWYYLNDNQVSPASERRVLEQQAYMLFYVRDRRNIVPRKPPTDVAQKENLKANANGNRTSSTFNHVLKEAVQNGPVEKRLSSATPAAVTRKDASNVVPSTVPIMKEVSLQKDNCLIKTECMVLKKDSVSENFSKVPLSNNPPEGLPVSKPKSIEALSQPAPSCNGDVPNFENTPKGKINDYNEKGKSMKDSSVSVATSPNFNDVQSSSTAKNVTDETSQKINLVSNIVPSEDLNDKTLKEMDPVGRTPNGSAVGTSLVEAAGGRVQKVELDESVKLSSLSSETYGLHTEAHNCKLHKKLKKKHLKCKVTSMQLHSHFLFRASLSLQKKKKHKRNKRRTLNTKNLSREHLLDRDCISADLGPSTSESVGTSSLHLSHPLRKGTKTTSEKRANDVAAKGYINSNGDYLMDVKIDGEFRQRIDASGTVLATDKQLDKSSGSSSTLAANQWEAVRSDDLKDSKREVMQNGLMSMLTRGLEETVVSHWDGIELPPCPIATSNDVESTSIGYVLDEWDEEYDRGKRKKVRQSQHSFGGINPFQAIATKKTQFKKAKVDRSSAGNQPFRIRRN